jgi:hypothetical protein
MRNHKSTKGLSDQKDLSGSKPACHVLVTFWRAQGDMKKNRIKGIIEMDKIRVEGRALLKDRPHSPGNRHPLHTSIKFGPS